MTAKKNTSMKLKKICIIDDHQIVRNGLKELLEKIDNFKVVYEFESGTAFLEALPLKDIDLYILDYSMPNLNGIEVLKQLEVRKEEYKVLLLTQHFDENIINEAYTHGARGFLHKNCTANDLKHAIENIMKIGYNNISEILKRVKNNENLHATSIKQKIDLSKKELEFITLVCNENELTYEQMSNIMSMSVKSIELIRAKLFYRYQIRSKVGLVLFSFKNKLTEPFL
jgi:DNA-binding NarL/FixJ family response regulator